MITRIENEEFEHVCLELGLVDTIVPEVTVARHLADMMEGRNPLELSAALGSDARLVSFVLGEDHEGRVQDIDMPGDSRIVCLYRDDELVFAEPDFALEKGDKIVALARTEDADTLSEKWSKG